MKQESNNQKGLSLWVMIGLVAVFVVAIILIFAMLEGVVAPTKEPTFEVTNADTGTASANYRFNTLSASQTQELPQEVIDWMAQCTQPGKHWLVVSTPNSWLGVLYLSDETPTLAPEQVSITENSGLNIYLSTLGLPQGGGGQLLAFEHKGSGQWPEAVTLTVNGGETDLSTQCIYNSGQYYWA